MRLQHNTANQLRAPLPGHHDDEQMTLSPIWHIMKIQMEKHHESYATGQRARTVPDKNGDENRLTVLRHDVWTRRALVDASRTGFDASLLAAAGDYFEVPAARIRAIARVPDTTAHRLVKRHALLDQWLRSPNQAFLGAAPIDYLDTKLGAKAVRQVINAIATGGAV
jgi:hypothetical protein